MQSPPIALMFSLHLGGLRVATRRQDRVRGAAAQAGFLAAANDGEADAAVGRYGEASPGNVYTCPAALASPAAPTAGGSAETVPPSAASLPRGAGMVPGVNR